MIRLNECESLVQGTSYPAMTRFKVWVGKVYMGEYDKGKMVKKFGDKWLDMAHEEGIKEVEIYLI